MVTIFALIVLAPLLVINLFFLAEMMVGLARSPARHWPAAPGRTVIIVPAHDEEQVIARTLAGLIEVASGNFAILVVADNCSDRTAKIARGAGVQVVERQDSLRQGKGFALAFARDHLADDPPHRIIVLDADCRTDRDSLDALAGACQMLAAPVQAINLLEAPPSASPMVQVSSFAFLIKNLVRQRGLQRLAGSVHLTGTGMCLPWVLFAKADLATASIVEDIRLGIELARKGTHPRLIEESVVLSPHAEQAQTLGQRSRWEGGFLALALATAPSLVRDGIMRLSPRTLVAGLDLAVPPLALLVLLTGSAFGLTLMLAATGLTSWLPAVLLGTVGLGTAVALLLAWWREGRAFLSLATMVRLPLYPLWKIPMYLSLARSGTPRSWNRTARPVRRDDGGAPPTA